MSVQVRRRREAASFLSSFVGAQGELLVDTTNNRLQVHDGTTPGGWPAAKLADVAARTVVADANYTALATDRLIAFTALTAARTLTLPAAASFPAGMALTVVDESGACSAGSAITLARSGSDTVNGAAGALIAGAYGYLALESNGAAKWTIIDAPAVAAASGTATTAQLTNRNAAINGNFAVNQRAYASGTALAANAYGHDRWRAGSGGATYTFTTAVPDTALAITTGTLCQPVDAGNVSATAWWLTWTGTAQARVWQGSASGSYASGTAASVGGATVNALSVAGLTVGTLAVIEFSTGSLGLVQFEAALPNAGPTRFERRLNEMALCQLYYQVIPGVLAQSPVSGYSAYPMTFARMRATPTVALSGVSYSSANNVSFSARDANNGYFQFNATAANGYCNASIILSAEL